MIQLTTDQAQKYLGETSLDECVPIKTFFNELSDLGVGTACGSRNNQCFHGLDKLFGHRAVYCWYNTNMKAIEETALIACVSETDALNIVRAIKNNGGSLNLDSQFDPEFWRFEIE